MDLERRRLVKQKLMDRQAKEEETREMIDIFLSYHDQHEKTVVKLHDALKSRGFKPSLDRDDAGVRAAVQKASVVIMCMSASYKESAICMKEIDQAKMLRKPIIPIKVAAGFKPSGWLELVSRSKTVIDFSDPKMFREKFTELLGELAAKKISNKEKSTPKDRPTEKSTPKDRFMPTEKSTPKDRPTEKSMPKDRPIEKSMSKDRPTETKVKNAVKKYGPSVARGIGKGALTMMTQIDGEEDEGEGEEGEEGEEEVEEEEEAEEEEEVVEEEEQEEECVEEEECPEDECPEEECPEEECPEEECPEEECPEEECPEEECPEEECPEEECPEEECPEEEEVPPEEEVPAEEEGGGGTGGAILKRLAKIGLKKLVRKGVAKAKKERNEKKKSEPAQEQKKKPKKEDKAEVQGDKAGASRGAKLLVTKVKANKELPPEPLQKTKFMMGRINEIRS